MAPTPAYELGVLLVHGIGSQRHRETLVHWGDSLVKTIRRAMGGRVRVWVEYASSGPGGCGAHAEVRVLYEGKLERWMVREALWADAFPPPSYRELVSWSVRAMPWAVVMHIAQSYWRHAPVDDKRWRDPHAAIVVFQLLCAWLFMPLFLVLVAAVLLLGLLPIPQLRAAMLAAQSALTATVGDSLAFVESPVRAGLIRGRVIAEFDELEHCCARTVILAHSQGAAVVLDALGGIAAAGETAGEASPGERPGSDRCPDALVTYGAGLNQLASLRVLADGLPSKLGLNPASGGVALTMIAAGVLAWILAGLATREISVVAVGRAIGVIVGGVVVAMPALLMYRRLSERPDGGEAPAAKRLVRFLAAVLAVVLLLYMIGLIVSREVFGLPILRTALLLLVAAGFPGVIALALGRGLRQAVTAPVRVPIGLKVWLDLYSSADPVPNGPTRTTGTNPPASRQIWNLGSLLADHTSYWSNRDGFVLPVARVLAHTAESSWAKDLPDEPDAADARAKWRVRHLRLSRWATGALWGCLGVLLIVQYGHRVPIPAAVRGWLPGPLTTAFGPAALAAGVVCAIWATARLSRWIWGWWNRAEQIAYLDGREPKKEAREVALLGMCLVVWLLAVLVLAMCLSGNEWLEARGIDPWNKPLWVTVLLFGTGLTFWAQRRFLPSPATSATASTPGTASPVAVAEVSALKGPRNSEAPELIPTAVGPPPAERPL